MSKDRSTPVGKETREDTKRTDEKINGDGTTGIKNLFIGKRSMVCIPLACRFIVFVSEDQTIQRFGSNNKSLCN